MLTMVKITNKTPERCHAVFIFNFEHVQMNLFFFHCFVTLNMYLSVGNWLKLTKQVKRTLNNIAFFL